MRVEDFPRPANDNRRGVHWSASVYHPTGAALDFWIGELQAMNVKWLKLLDDGGGSSLELCQRLLAADIMPIVRLYRLEPNPGHIGGREEDTVRRLVANGVRYFETNNEPDLPAEWKGGRMPPNAFDVVVDNFIYDADLIISLGGLPAFPAMGVGAQDNPVELVVQRGRGDLFSSGAWVAVHNYTLNHPLDYPFDPVNQEGEPVSQEEFARLGTWAWEGHAREQINAWRAADKNPGATLLTDATCFLAFQLLDEMITQTLGHKVPILSTEGGPVLGWKDDRRYPRTDPATHAAWVVAINDFMQGGRAIHGMQCPDNYFTMCHWLLANYRLGFMAPGWESQCWYSDWWNDEFHLRGELPVVAAVKTMQSISVDGTRQAVVTGRVLRADNDAPLADLAVVLSAAGHEVDATVTAADGAFRFERLAPGSYDVALPAWGVVRKDVTATLEPAQPVIIRLTGGRGSALTGAVQDATGAPLAGVHVTLRRDGAPVDETDAAAEGAFSFNGLPMGVYQVAAAGVTVAGISLDGWQARHVVLATLGPAGQRYTVAERRLLAPEETAGRNIFYGVVMDAGDAPINGIKVEMSWQGAEPDTEFPTMLTGHDPYKPTGAYEFIHSQGTFRLRVVQGDGPSDSADDLDTAQVPGREGQPIAYEVNFRRQPMDSLAQVSGVAAGAPSGRSLRLIGPAGTRETPLAADGSFTFAELAPGSYTLALAGVGVIAGEIALEPGAHFRQFFPMQSHLAGQVLAAPDGLLAVLYAPPAWGWTRQAMLELDGSFAFEGLPPGRYRVEIGQTVLAGLELTGENRLRLATIDLAQGRHSAVRGRVADGAGRPQGDVLLSLRRDGLIVTQARTAADGAYRFAELAAGVYQLEVAGMGVVADGILLDGQREYVADVLWDGDGPRSTLQGRVLKADGAPIGGAQVRLLCHDVEAGRTQTDANGAFRFSALAGGLYALAVGDSAPLATDIQVDEDATVTRDLVLPPDAPKLLGAYLLFGPPPAPGTPSDAETRLILQLAADYMLRAGAAGGFSVDEAAQAQQVILVGDVVPASVEASLRTAGCQVTRLTGQGFALAEAIMGLSTDKPA